MEPCRVVTSPKPSPAAVLSRPPTRQHLPSSLVHEYFPATEPNVPVTGLLSFLVTPPLPMSSNWTFWARREALRTALMATCFSRAYDMVLGREAVVRERERRERRWRNVVVVVVSVELRRREEGGAAGGRAGLGRVLPVWLLLLLGLVSSLLLPFFLPLLQKAKGERR